MVPVKATACIRIQRAFILKEALRKLNISEQTVQTVKMGDGSIVVVITIDFSRLGNNAQPQAKLFYSKHTSSVADGLEDASDKAIKYLKLSKLVYIDDSNYHDLQVAERKLKRSIRTKGRRLKKTSVSPLWCKSAAPVKLKKMAPTVSKQGRKMVGPDARRGIR